MTSKIISMLEGWGNSFLGWLEGAAQGEVNALAPIATAAVSELTAEEAAALASGNQANTGHILAAVVKKTATAAEVAGITAAAPSILAAVGHAASNAPAHVAAAAAASGGA